MKSKKSFDKLRGGYYTPQAITEFICKWIINKNTKKILEPSCGDGNFLKAIVERIENLNLNLDISSFLDNRPCKAWYAQVFTYCSTSELENELNFFLFLINLFSQIFGFCFNQENTVFLGCVCPCGHKQIVLYYTIGFND